MNISLGAFLSTCSILMGERLSTGWTISLPDSPRKILHSQTSTPRITFAAYAFFCLRPTRIFGFRMRVLANVILNIL